MRSISLLVLYFAALIGVSRAIHDELTDGSLQFEISKTVPENCKELGVYSVTGLFCPELKHLYHTGELLNNGLDGAKDLLEERPLFIDAINHTRGRETAHPDTMILVLDSLIDMEAQVWRIEGSDTQDYEVEFTLLFTIPIQTYVKQCQVFDNFALIEFDDQTIYIINRPEELGGVAEYGCCDETIGDGLQDFLIFDKKTEVIMRWVILPMNEENLYKMTLSLAVNETAQVYQYTLEYDPVETKGVFSPFGQISKIPFPVNSLTTVDATQDLIVAGCSSCNDGYGRIIMYDAKESGLLSYTVEGNPETGKKVGNSVIIQVDELSSGNRIWYSTENAIMASSLISYVGEPVFEDEIFTQAEPEVVSNIGQHGGHFLFTVRDADTQEVHLVSFSACSSGLAYSFSATNAMKDRECSQCEVGYYSLGWNGECTECSLLDRAGTHYFFETNLIDNICFEENEIVQTVKEILNNDPKTMKYFYIILSGVLLIAAVVTTIVYLKGKCCRCCYRKRVCCCRMPKLPRMRRRPRRQESEPGVDNDNQEPGNDDSVRADFDEGQEARTAEKPKNGHGLVIDVDHVDDDINADDKNLTAPDEKVNSKKGSGQSTPQEMHFLNDIDHSNNVFINEGGDFTKKPTAAMLDDKEDGL